MLLLVLNESELESDQKYLTDPQGGGCKGIVGVTAVPAEVHIYIER